MKSPQPSRSTRVTLLFDLLITISAPLVVVYFVAVTLSQRPFTISIFGLLIVVAACTWFSDVERRRRWIRDLGARTSRQQ